MPVGDGNSRKAPDPEPLKTLVLGADALDSQHVFLFRIAEELQEAIRTGQSRPVLEELLGRLTAYVVLHFSTEEKLMAEIDYPGLEEHRMEHDAVRKKILHLERRFCDGEDASKDEILEIVRGWAQYHIPNADRELADYLAARTPS